MMADWVTRLAVMVMGAIQPRCYQWAHKETDMLRMTLVASFLLTSAAACIDDGTTTDDSTAESTGKGDSFSTSAERKVLDEDRRPDHLLQDASYVYYTKFTAEDEIANPQTL